jgi:hypothetical protein
MAEYKGIKGFKVQYLSADPSDPNIGQTWYNSTSKDLKYTGVTTAGAWATGNLNTARSFSNSRNSNSRIRFWWYILLQELQKNMMDQLGHQILRFKYSKRAFLGGCGTQTAALGFGGTPPITGATEEYDGSTWTSNPTGLNTARDI